jgi:hypothetical protein
MKPRSAHLQGRAIPLVLWAVVLGMVLILFTLFAASRLAGTVTEDHARVVQVSRDLAAIAGIVGVLVAAAGHFAAERERRRSWALQRLRLAAELMNKFYEDPNLEDVRAALRGSSAFPQTETGQPRLTRDVVRLMTLLETLGIAVKEECLDAETVDLMLGAPILEIAAHPVARQLVNVEPREDLLDGSSFEAYEQYLYPAIVKSRERRKRNQ